MITRGSLDQVWQVTLGGKRTRLYAHRIDGSIGSPGVELPDQSFPTDVSLTSQGTLLSISRDNFQFGYSTISRILAGGLGSLRGARQSGGPPNIFSISGTPQRFAYSTEPGLDPANPCQSTLYPESRPPESNTCQIGITHVP